MDEEETEQKVQTSGIEAIDIVVIGCLLVALGMGGAGYWLYLDIQELEDVRIPRQRENAQETVSRINEIEQIRAQAPEGIEEQRESLTNLGQVVEEELRNAGITNPGTRFDLQYSPPEEMDQHPYRQGGYNITFQELPLAPLTRTLWRLENRLPTLKSVSISLEDINFDEEQRHRMIGTVDVSFRFYLPVEA